MSVDSFTALYERAVDPQRLTSPFITGHLVIEFLLRKLIQIYDGSLSCCVSKAAEAARVDDQQGSSGIDRGRVLWIVLEAAEVNCTMDQCSGAVLRCVIGECFSVH
jgi:hypothetical protein